MPAASLFIIGAGRHGLEVDAYVGDLVRGGAALRFVGYVDERKPPGSAWGSGTVLGGLSELRAHLDDHPRERFHYITAVGDNRARRTLVEKLEQVQSDRLTPLSVHHSFTVVGPHVKVGAGTCMAPGSVITTHVTIGQHVIVRREGIDIPRLRPRRLRQREPWRGHLRQRHSGRRSYVGAGAVVIEDITIGEWSIVGAGASVVRDACRSRVTVAGGVPAPSEASRHLMRRPGLGRSHLGA